MIPVVTPEQMAAIDAAAPESVDELIARAAFAVASRAVELLGGTYGRRVVVVAGPGHNGNDGRVAADVLRARGARVAVIDAADAPAVLPECDLVIDAAFGTGFHGTYEFPDPGLAPVLAVDIPSGLSGHTGVAGGAVAHALSTVTFAALKPGLLFGAGPAHAGEVVVADIGLDVDSASTFLVEDSDVVAWVPPRASDDHKWRHAVWVVGGSPGMTGAPTMSAAAAFRAGAGYVRWSVPGAEVGSEPADLPLEVVSFPLDAADWAASVTADVSRFGAVALGPGLGRSDAAGHEVRALLRSLEAPVVVDGDALWLLGTEVADVVGDRPAPTVLTPHDGEFERLTGTAPGDDRIAATTALAARTGAVVLLKGPTTVVAGPDGTVLLVRAGDSRLATAGTGDVLTGIVAAFLACGATPLRAAGAAAQLHGLAADHGPGRGLVASDLVALLPSVWSELIDGATPGRA